MDNVLSMKFFQNKNQLVVHVFCVCFVVFNIFTLEWEPLPWIDDVSLVDSPVNFVLDGEWRTTAVNGDRHGDVYSLYPPLYQFVLVPFIWIFGASPISCRSLNVLLVYVFCLFIYQLFQKKQLINNYYSIIVFLLLIWSASTFSWIYRNGRPDILNMVCATGFLISYYQAKSKWRLILFSCLTIMSGIQACPYILGILVCIYSFQQDRKRARKGMYMFILGSLSSLFITSVYSYLQGHLLDFYYRTFMFSSTAKRIVCVFSLCRNSNTYRYEYKRGFDETLRINILF